MFNCHNDCDDFHDENGQNGHENGHVDVDAEDENGSLDDLANWN